MKALQRLLGRLNGLHYSQDYLCLDKALFHRPIHAWLAEGQAAIREITHSHAFIGYRPLLFAIPSDQGPPPTSIEIIFTHRPLSPNERFGEKDAVARLKMEKTRELSAGEAHIGIFEGKYGRHSFLPGLQQYAIRLNDRLYNRKPGNVFLPGNLLSQVQVAYSLPRTISLITVMQDGRYNLFPTDLHGPVSSTHYLVSLRHQGKACAQVVAAGNLLLSEMKADSYREVYALGKNHMQDPRPREQFNFAEDSAPMGLPIPIGATRYRELYLEEHFIHGIHRVMLFRISGLHSMTDASTLAHIHNVYATWRNNHGMEGNYLMR